MKRQIQVSINNEESVVIDLVGDESVSVDITDPPSSLELCKGQKPFIKIDGLRWRDGEHFHLSWFEKELTVDDCIVIQYKESDELASGTIKEIKYDQPEEKCSFCHKKKSEVDLLISGPTYNYICDACVVLSHNLIQEKIKD
ncbi:MAG: ClpX C4-type zinc finger protein [Gammaproteobacteria bacterium]|nr:ClpX C4-type zinc finger protein [Gammaproteobacteria bacterium]MDH5631275.1 ClpX C4-type zinc finger protein [Gammaproteobacteria bacterium]